MKLCDAKDCFLSHLRFMKGASAHTLRNYESDLHEMIMYMEDTVSVFNVGAVSRSLLRQYIAFLSQKGLKKRSIARKIASLRSFCTFCMREKWIEIHPMEGIEGPKLEKRLPVFLTYQQVEYFLSLPDIKTVLGLRDKALLELFYSSGIRVSELVQINVEDLFSSELLVKIRGKGKKERVVPITPTALSWIEAYMAHPERICVEGGTEPIFLNTFGKRLTTRSVDRLTARYRLQSGFSSHITPHVIRHTIATHWLENGMDLKTIQMILGHSSMATTTIYTEVRTSLKKKAIAECHPRGV